MQKMEDYLIDKFPVRFSHELMYPSGLDLRNRIYATNILKREMKLIAEVFLLFQSRVESKQQN